MASEGPFKVEDDTVALWLFSGATVAAAGKNEQGHTWRDINSEGGGFGASPLYNQAGYGQLKGSLTSKAVHFSLGGKHMVRWNEGFGLIRNPLLVEFVCRFENWLSSPAPLMSVSGYPAGSWSVSLGTTGNRYIETVTTQYDTAPGSTYVYKAPKSYDDSFKGKWLYFLMTRKDPGHDNHRLYIGNLELDTDITEYHDWPVGATARWYDKANSITDINIGAQGSACLHIDYCAAAVRNSDRDATWANARFKEVQKWIPDIPPPAGGSIYRPNPNFFLPVPQGF